MAVTTIDWKNFIAGESSNDWTPDGGFSPKSYGLNLTKERGVLHFREASTTITTAPTGNLIASANDRNYLGNEKYFLDDEGAFYYLSGTTLTKAQTDPGSDTFRLGTSDLLQFNLVTYATSTDSLWALTGSDLDSLDKTTTLSFDATFRHPMETVDNEVFIGDKNVIHYFDNVGNTGTAFTLPPQTNVTTLRKHPNGRTLLAFCGTTGDLNGARTRAGEGFVYYCNPVTRESEREVKLAAQVEGTRTVGGIIYATWGDNLGIFDGSGLRFLKKLETSATTYSQSMTNMEDIMMVRDGLDVLAFGNLGAGNVWWKPFRNSTNANNINVVSYKGDNKLLVAFAGDSSDGILEEVDYDNSGFNGQFYSNRFFFDQEVSVKRMEFFHDTTASQTNFDVESVDVADTASDIANVRHTSQSTNKTKFNCDVKTDVFQFSIQPLNDDIGHKLIRTHYDRAE